MADVTRNGALRAAGPAKRLEATARTKIGARGSRQAFGQGVETTGTLPVTPRRSPAPLPARDIARAMPPDW